MASSHGWTSCGLRRWKGGGNSRDGSRWGGSQSPQRGTEIIAYGFPPEMASAPGMSTHMTSSH
eukprot:6526289-Pyramimonas_sp.AAC.1